MIYEMRVYTVKPGAVAEYEARFAEGYKAREKYSKLGAMWHTEIGPLNQVIHVWQYESLQQRADIRATAAKDPSGLWPPKTNDLLVSQEVEILDPVKGMKDWGEPQQWGSLYEMRQYTYAPGDINKAATAFGEALAARDAIAPVAGMFVARRATSTASTRSSPTRAMHIGKRYAPSSASRASGRRTPRCAP